MRRTPRRVPPEKRVRPQYDGDRVRYSIRLRPAELAELRRRAAAAGTTVSEYVRACALSEPGCVVVTGVDYSPSGTAVARGLLTPPAGDAGANHKENGNA